MSEVAKVGANAIRRWMYGEDLDRFDEQDETSILGELLKNSAGDVELTQRLAWREQIASALGIQKAFIKDYLADWQALRASWEVAHKERTRSRYRAHFLQVLSENPGVPIERIRRISGNGFQWLLRNDREWLANHLPGIWHRPDQLE